MNARARSLWVKGFLLSVALPLAFCSTAQDLSNPTDTILYMAYDELVADLNGSRVALQRALAESRANHRETAVGECLDRLGTVYYLEGTYDSSLYYGLAAIDHYRVMGDRVRLGSALCGLGHQIKRRDLPEAFRRFQQGLQILEAEQATDELKANYDNYGVLHEMNQDLDSAEYFYHRSLRIKEEQGDSVGIPYSLNKLATVHVLRKEFDDALEKFETARSIRRRLDDRLGLAEQESYFGDLYEAWGRYPEAILHFQSAIDQAANVGYVQLQQTAYSNLARCMEHTGDLAGALYATRAGEELKDSLLNEQNMRTILELEERFYAVERVQRIHELASRAERRTLIIWIGSALLALFIAVVSLIQQRRIRLERARTDAEIILEREKGLRAIFVSTEKERQRIAKELHDGIGQQLSAARFRLDELQSKWSSAPGALAEVAALVDATAHETRELSHQMMPRTLRTLGLSPALKDMVQKALRGTSIEYSYEQLGQAVDVRGDEATALYRIAQELINNVTKHSRARKVNVQLVGTTSGTMLMVEDDGIGIREETSYGMGLLNIAERARTFGGSFHISRGLEQGTVAVVRLP